MRGKTLIGLYTEDGVLIGYKADSFWSLTKNRDHAKPHFLTEGGNIPENMVRNLRSTLRNDGPTGKGLASDAARLVDILQTVTKEAYYDRFETRLLGYEDLDLPPVFTHRVFENDVQELSPEDSIEITGRIGAKGDA